MATHLQVFHQVYLVKHWPLITSLWMAWHLPPLLTMFNVYLFIPYLGNIYRIPVDQYCSEGLKVSKHFSTPPTPPRQKKGEPKTKLPEICRNVVKDLIEVDPKKKSLEVWLWTNKKTNGSMRNKKQTVFMRHMFFFHGIFVAGPNQETIECELPFPLGVLYPLRCDQRRWRGTALRW